MYALISSTRVALAAALAALAASAFVVATPASAAPAPTQPRFVQVATSYFSSAALTAEGEVFTWGDGASGSLGLGESVRASATPRLVTFPGKPDDDPVIELALGIKHALALTERGEVWVWGMNDYGQLGIGAEYDIVWEPTPVGIDDYLHDGEKVVHVAAGDDHSLALTNTNGLFGWGDNYYYQVSYDEPDLYVYTPVEYFAVRDMFDDAGRTATRISAFDWSSYVMSDDAWDGGERVFAWGYNGEGRLGIGTANYGENRGHMFFAGADPDARIVDFDAGVRHGIAVLDDGTVWSWGALPEGTSRLTPGRVAGLPDPATSKVVAVAAGQDVSFALTDDGRLFSWGSNGPAGEGQLGTGATGDVIVATPTEMTVWPEVLGSSRIVDVAGGFRYAAGAVSETGGVYMWGAGWSRGDGSTDDASIPVNIALGPVAPGTASLGGTPYVGAPLTAVADGWPSHASIVRVDWEVDGSPVSTGPSYTPTDGDEGFPLTVTITALAENWQSSSATSAPATVLAGTPHIDAIALPDATAGLLYSRTLTAAGAPPISFAISDGGLPVGIVLEPDGSLTGRPTSAGTYTFTVSATSAHGVDERTFTLLVLPGPTTELDLSASATTVSQGGSLTFTVLGRDDFGNSTGDLTAQAILTSDVATDVVNGNTVTFPHASPHTITASYGQVSAELVVEVVPAATGGLAGTGSDLRMLLAAGGLLLVIGTGIPLIRRTRRLARAACSGGEQPAE